MEDETTIIEEQKLFQQKRNYIVLLSVLLDRKWIKQLATTQLHKVQPIGKTIEIFNIFQLYIDMKGFALRFPKQLQILHNVF